MPEWPLPEAVTERLAGLGLGADELEGHVPRCGDDLVLLAGSYATGEARPSSDLDILVLCARDDRRHQPEGATNHPSTFGDSFDVDLGGLPLNVEYVDPRRVDEVCDVLAMARPADGPPDLPNLQPLEVRLLQRVATGLPLLGGGDVDRLRRRIDLDLVTASAAALAFVMAMSLLEDVVTSGRSEPERRLLTRAAGESLVLAAVNVTGQATYDVKHLYRRGRAAADGPDSPAVLRELDTALLLAPAEQPVESLLGLARDLWARLRADPEKPVWQMLAPFEPTWDWARER